MIAALEAADSDLMPVIATFRAPVHHQKAHQTPAKPRPTGAVSRPRRRHQQSRHNAKFQPRIPAGISHRRITVYLGDEDTFLNILHADIERSGTVVANLSDHRLAAHMPQSYVPCIDALSSMEYHNRSDGQYVQWAKQNADATNSKCPAQADAKTNLVVFQIRGEE